MRRFGSKKSQLDKLIHILKKHPDDILVTPAYMATYSSKFKKIIVIPGDFTHLSDEEAQSILEEKISKFAG